MGSVNKVILIGNLGKDPVVRTIPNGTKVASFSIATTEVYKDKEGQKKEQTEWHNIVAWRNMAETAERFLKKGSPVYIEGKLRTRKWQDSEGKDRYSVEVNADSLVLIGARQSDSSQSSSYQNENESGFNNAPANNQSSGIQSDPIGGSDTPDDLPF
ncbi:MAG: single-stranded DNA-binding protein [Bacteroidota bacterium]